MTTNKNITLYVATYDDAYAAADDFRTLQDEQDWDDLRIIGAVVLERNVEGDVKVKEHRTGFVGRGTATGGIIGLVVGLFSPPLLLSTVVGSSLGAGIGVLLKRADERDIGVELREYLPAGSSAIVAVVDDKYADRIDKAITKSAKKISKAIDRDDYAKLRKELDNAGYRIEDAILS